MTARANLRHGGRLGTVFQGGCPSHANGRLYPANKRSRAGTCFQLSIVLVPPSFDRRRRELLSDCRGLLNYATAVGEGRSCSGAEHRLAESSALRKYQSVFAVFTLAQRIPTSGQGDRGDWFEILQCWN